MKLRMMVLTFMGILLMSVSGCGKSYIEPVSGTVTVNGKPCANLHVRFQPVAVQGEEALGMGASGLTDANGHYVLEQANVNNDIVKGATFGKNRVTITARPPEKKPEEVVASLAGWKSPLPGNVPSIETEFDVPAGGTTEANFDLPLK